MYRKLKRTWSHNALNYIPRFRETFPELKKVSSEELCDRFIEMKMDFYCEEKTAVNPWIRLTLPFALILMVLMILGIPLYFLISGKWHYPLSENNCILNWFRQLKILF